jgi:GntR family transcriptional regulator
MMKSRTEPKPGPATSSKRITSTASAAKQKAPLYLQVARELKAEIVSGIYPVGASITTEDELCKRFSVSRHTVREAIRVLRDDGLVASRQGAGTVVIPPRTISADMHQVMSINDLLAFASDARFEIESMKMVAIDAKLAARTGIPAGEEWLEVLGYRRTEAADAPVSRAEYYINRAFAAVGRLLQRHSGPIFPLIEDLFGQRIVEVQQQISATLTSRALAGELNVKEGSAALEVRRTYKTADERIAQVTINTHPSSRFQHSMTMRWVKA